MASPKYDYAPDKTQLPLVFVFTLISLFAYYRMISMVVYEREKRIIENMENMGMKKINYIGSCLLFHLTYYFLLSLITVPLIKGAFLQTTNIGLIFVIYWVFVFWIISLAYFISDFFVTTKNAGIGDLVIFFILYLFNILMD